MEQIRGGRNCLLSKIDHTKAQAFASQLSRTQTRSEERLQSQSQRRRIVPARERSLAVRAPQQESAGLAQSGAEEPVSSSGNRQFREGKRPTKNKEVKIVIPNLFGINKISSITTDLRGELKIRPGRGVRRRVSRIPRKNIRYTRFSRRHNRIGHVVRCKFPTARNDDRSPSRGR